MKQQKVCFSCILTAVNTLFGLGRGAAVSLEPASGKKRDGCSFAVI